MGGSNKSSRQQVVSSLHFAALNHRLTDDAYGIILGMKQKNLKFREMDLSTSLEMTEDIDLSTAVEMTEVGVEMTKCTLEMTGGAV